MIFDDGLYKIIGGSEGVSSPLNYIEAEYLVDKYGGVIVSLTEDEYWSSL